MKPKKTYMTIKALTDALNDMATMLDSGILNPDEITVMKEHAQQLYERLVVLHFKAFEADDAPFAKKRAAATSMVEEPVALPASAKADEPEDAPAKPDEQQPEPSTQSEVAEPIEPLQAQDKEAPEEGPAFRFGPPQVAPNQISLIDSIEEIKRMESSINDQFKGVESKTLSHKLKQSPVADLKTAIGINMRFQFTATLFGNDAEAYARAIDKLNAFTSFLEADEYIQNGLKDRYDWQMKSPEAKQFLELVERRYF
jgi:hypothetical protein